MKMKQQYPVHVYGTMNCIALCAGIFLPTVHHRIKKMFIFLNRYTFVFVNLQHKLNLFSQFFHYLRKCNELLFLNYKQKKRMFKIRKFTDDKMRKDDFTMRSNKRTCIYKYSTYKMYLY